MAIKTKKISEETRSLLINDNDYSLFVSDVDGTPSNKIVSVKTLKEYINGDSSNEYIKLFSEDGEKEYRLTLNSDGKIQIFPSEAYTAEPYEPGANLLSPFKVLPTSKITALNNSGLVINQIYGGGSLTTTETSVSHNFIELYNRNSVEINLKGVYLWYKPNGGDWVSLALRGIIPPYHSFLIRGNALYDINNDIVRCKITEYDQEWNQSFTSNGFSAYLCIGSEKPEAQPVKYRLDALGKVTYTDQRYIDLIGGGGSQPTHTIDAYVGDYYNMGMNEKCALRRVNFYDGKSSKEDTVIINYAKCDVSKFRPRSLKDGAWDLTADKMAFNDHAPNIINMCYGEDGSKTRTFTFQTVITDEKAYVKYRPAGVRLNGLTGLGESKWISVETKPEIVSLHDKDIMIHRAIITDLRPGFYEYRCGFDGCYSETETFEVKEYGQEDHLKFIWTTDEQGWTMEEYEAVDRVYRAIEDNEFNEDGTPDFDFHLNTGDISQNGSNPYEWRAYFKHHGPTKRTMPHMLTCGNNDLINKKYGTAFKQYATFENAPKINEYEPHVPNETDEEMVSSHSYDVGFTHFVCINSNTEYMYPALSTEQFLQKQCDFLDKDLTKVSQRAVKPRWIIVYMHLSPFTIVRTKRLQKFIPIFEKHKVDFVLCGHNHTYSRSIPLYTGYKGSAAYNDYVTTISNSSELNIKDIEYKDDDNAGLGEINRQPDIANGTYYLMSQASGYKIAGKEKAIKLPAGLDDKHYAHDPESGEAILQPWWYAYTGNLPVQPSYIVADLSYDEATFKAYYVKDVLETTEEGITLVNEYDKEKNEVYLFDTLTVRHSDRNK